MSSIRPDLGIEYTLIRVPYDSGVKTFKGSKKTIEKEMSSILNSIIALKKEPHLTKTQTTTSINGLITRLKTLKRKLDDNYHEEDEIYECCKKRLLRLGSVDIHNKENVTEYQASRVNQLILEQLVRNDYMDTAKVLSKEYGMEDFMSVDAKILQEYNTIIRDLGQKSCGTAFQWCQANKTKLLRINSQFEIKLIFQEFIELLKSNQRTEALEYIRRCPEPIKNQHIDEIKKAMGCLTFYNQIDKLPSYKLYFEETRWDDLISIFRHDSFLVSGVTINTNLEISLKAGLSALKTDSCLDQKLHKPESCPVCNPSMKKLAMTVPSTHKVVSSLICRISGEVMDEHNPPVSLPNGQVYSEKALKKMADRDDGKIVCPTTKMEYTVSDLKKIYVS